MRASDDDKNVLADTPGLTLAVGAEALFLANLLILPGIAFVVLVALYLTYRRKAPALAACHLRQTFTAGVWAGVALIIVNGAIIALGGYGSHYAWMAAILYFTCVHATLVVLGTLGLAKAMAGQHFHFPLIGPRCPGAGD